MTTPRNTIELEDKDIILVEQPRWQFSSGKIGWALLWLLGIPLPVLLIIYLLRGH